MAPTTPTVGRPRGVDLAVALGLAALGSLTLPVVDRSSATDVAVDPFAVALVLVAAAALVVRRSHPVPVLAVSGAATATYLAIGYPYGFIMFCLAVAVYSIARHRPFRRALAGSATVLAASLVHLFTNDLALDGFAGVLPASAWVAIPFTIGAARRQVADARDRERAEADRRLVDAERLRVAHEVHDVVGHGLAAIQMQADIALHVRHSRPDQADTALAEISRARHRSSCPSIRVYVARLCKRIGDGIVGRVEAASSALAAQVGLQSGWVRLAANALGAEQCGAPRFRGPGPRATGSRAQRDRPAPGRGAADAEARRGRPRRRLRVRRRAGRGRRPALVHLGDDPVQLINRQTGDDLA